jgi:hypothetical protein
MANANAINSPQLPTTPGSAGNILRSDGTRYANTTATYPNTTTINQILYSSAANTIGGITTANNGVLSTDGSGVPSVGSTLPSGLTIPDYSLLTERGVVLMSTASASSSASISFTDITGYNNYLVMLYGVSPATNAAVLQMRASINNGSSYLSAASSYFYQAFSAITTTLAAASSIVATEIPITTALTNAAPGDAGHAGEIFLHGFGSALRKTITSYGYHLNSTPTPAKYETSANIVTASAVNAIQFFMSAGNIATGEFQLYGIR